MPNRILPYSPWQRLKRIREIIEAVDDRAMVCDGNVPTTVEEMTQAEMSTIYALAGGKPGK
jgi:hypothetical protein